ncbi:PREDICTED: serum response factor-binding protein 1-like [Dinoponera quadriceps]|uniref:Serum response factor-binding protein 1-like n=1 Tax=Dinoponera quadriceps TaxID=609295 RepID=A0A6P3X373_DINQU|nr:PREDICTED: serum response factor-binding protein 1-like [Dinoponera quadriceps]
MGKVEINNEIVSLRHTARQARVCVINKLIRYAKRLQDKNGNEKQREKNKRKADKLVAEVYALKTIKDDEISKFGIMNEKEAEDIVNDQSSSKRDRILARVISYKSFNRRLMEFREKFPDYKMYLSEDKKKTAKLKKKDSAKCKKLLAEDNHHSQHEDSKEQNVNSNNINEDSEKQKVNSGKVTEMSQYNSKDEETKSCEVKSDSHTRKKSLNKDDTALVDKKLPKLVGNDTLEDANKQPTAIKLCSVTKEGTVKRFVEFLEEQNSAGDARDPPERPTSAEGTDHERTITVRAKSVDDFFVTGNDEEGYRENRTNASVSFTRSDAPARTLRSSSRVKTQNPRYKNDVRGSKTPKYNQLKEQSRGEKVAKHKECLDEQSFAMRQEKRPFNRNNKSTSKNNPSDVSDRGETVDLHPSWLAKKKQLEAMGQKFQGKKIVFADD